MAGRSMHPPRDPAEGSREVVERELKRQAKQQEKQRSGAKPGSRLASTVGGKAPRSKRAR